MQLALDGHRAVQEANEERRDRRLAALEKHSGILSGACGPGYLHQLTLAEVLVAPARQNTLDTVREALEDLEVHELIFPADSAITVYLPPAATRLKLPSLTTSR